MVGICEGGLVLGEAGDSFFEVVCGLGLSIVLCHGCGGRSDQFVRGASLNSRPRNNLR